jgi:hypothetical protein
MFPFGNSSGLPLLKIATSAADLVFFAAWGGNAGDELFVYLARMLRSFEFTTEDL